jgi:hypothetical protein
VFQRRAVLRRPVKTSPDYFDDVTQECMKDGRLNASITHEVADLGRQRVSQTCFHQDGPRPLPCRKVFFLECWEAPQMLKKRADLGMGKPTRGAESFKARQRDSESGRQRKVPKSTRSEFRQ